MNIRFLAQSDYFNGVQLKDDIVLEKEYEDSPFENLKKVHYYLYSLEKNKRKEIMPRTEKLDVFTICDCTYRPDYIYFTEYDDQYDGTYVFNIIKYNYMDGTWSRLIYLKDDMSNYPYEKQIKIFILDDSHLIIQKAVSRRNLQDNYDGFFDFSSILFDFDTNRRIPVIDENLVLNGIDYILPFTENLCVMKTGFSLMEDGRHELLSKEEASVESLILVNIQQLISDLLLQQSGIVMQTVDQAFYDETIPAAKIVDNFLIYSRYHFETSDERITFLNLSTRDSIECITENTTGSEQLSKAFILGGVPHIRIDQDDETQFFNLETREFSMVFPKDQRVVFVNGSVIVSTQKRRGILGSVKDYVCIHKYPSPEVVLKEKGKYLGAVASDGDTTFIFLK